MACKNPFVKSKLIAHRGASLLAPENTLAAMNLAADLGAEWVEVDVKITSDDQPVIIHDDELGRTTNGNGWVVNHTLEEIRTLTAGGSGDGVYASEKVPTLRELLELCLERDIGLQLELKPTAGDDVETAEIALAMLKDIWPANNNKLFVSSFSIRSLDVARRVVPNIPRGFAVCVPPRDPQATLRDLDCQILHCTTFVLSDEQLATLDQSGVEFAIATVNDADRAREILSNGAQTILSDDAQLFGQLIQSKNSVPSMSKTMPKKVGSGS